MRTVTGQPRIRLYVSRWCAQCQRAVALLERHGVPFEAFDVDGPDGCCRLHELTGGRSVPQAVVDGRPIGGYDELAALLRTLDSQPRVGPAETAAAQRGSSPPG